MSETATSKAGVDCHAHYYPPEYLDAVRGLVDEPGEVGEVARFTVNHPIVSRDPMFTGRIEERLEMMDAAGIGIHVLSWAAPNLWHPDPLVRSRIVSVFNDSALGLAEQNPGRFKLFANMPLPHTREAIAETERLIDHPDVVGVGLCTHAAGLPFEHDSFQPAFAAWNERSTTVFLHPDGFCVPGVLEDYGMTWSLGTPFDDTVVLYRLIYSGMLRRYPDITWIVPHLGGAFPFLLARLDFIWELAPDARAALPAPPSSFLDNVFFDVVSPQPASVRLTAEVIGVDHLVLGSDFPYASRHDLGFAVEILRQAGLADDDVRRILRSNIAERLGLASAPVRTVPDAE